RDDLVTGVKTCALPIYTRIMKKLGAAAQINGEAASTAIDGDPNTFVLAGDPKAPLREPVELAITFPSPVAMSGLVLMPRQNHREIGRASCTAGDYYMGQ